MLKLRWAGLLIMILSSITLFVLFFNEPGWGLFGGLLLSVPGIICAMISWGWPRGGGISAIVLSVIIIFGIFISADFATISVEALPEVLPYVLLPAGSVMAFIPAWRIYGVGKQPEERVEHNRVLTVLTYIFLVIATVIILFLNSISLFYGRVGDSHPMVVLWWSLGLSSPFIFIALVLKYLGSRKQLG